MVHLELGKARIFVRPGATDMRKQINGLVLLVQEEMETSPFETALPHAGGTTIESGVTARLLAWDQLSIPRHGGINMDAILGCAMR